MKELIGLAITLILMTLLIWAVVLVHKQEQAEIEKWELFKNTHNCKVVEVKKGQVTHGSGTGVSSTGGVAIVATSSRTPDQKAWLCDDGLKYWRNE